MSQHWDRARNMMGLTRCDPEMCRKLAQLQKKDQKKEKELFDQVVLQGGKKLTQDQKLMKEVIQGKPK